MLAVRRSTGSAKALAMGDPKRFVAVATKARRVGRVSVDWLRNGRDSTAVLPYSARARPHAPLAMLVPWSELRDMRAAGQWTVTMPTP